MRANSIAENPRSEWPVSTDDLVKQYRGRRFGELVLYHLKRQSLSQVIAALMDTNSLLPAQLQGVTEEWIDINNRYGQQQLFWRSDCGEVCSAIIERAKEYSAKYGARPDNDTILNLFQIIVLSFAYTAHREPRSKAFIQKAIGVGFFRRFLSAYTLK